MIMPSHSADSAPICTSITSLISYKAQGLQYEHPKNLELRDVYAGSQGAVHPHEKHLLGSYGAGMRKLHIGNRQRDDAQPRWAAVAHRGILGGFRETIRAKLNPDDPWWGHSQGFIGGVTHVGRLMTHSHAQMKRGT